HCLLSSASSATYIYTLSLHDALPIWQMFVLVPVVPVLLLTLLGYHQYWWRILALQSRERELAELAATAQLAALRAQINPHFLFRSEEHTSELPVTWPSRMPSSA